MAGWSRLLQILSKNYPENGISNDLFRYPGAACFLLFIDSIKNLLFIDSIENESSSNRSETEKRQML